MKTYNPISTTEKIDWSKPMWVQSNINKKLIVLTNGEHHGEDFAGTALPSDHSKHGLISDEWQKSAFTPLVGTIMFPVSNDED